jgi:5-methylcytosine-specific restriction endonuclease McrA
MNKNELIVIEYPNGSAFYNGWSYTKKRRAYLRRAKDLGTHTNEEWLKLCEEYDFKCCKCNGEVIGGIPTKDHVIPIRLGGSDSIKNIQPLCRQCNIQKGNTIADYRRSK